ncbi:defective proboscis extension response [Culex quinquefasciatus]|uniref:Defective proboscis extension response n=1 Tax=Culex quinquefasciatus TaxID=7176 RepID=B0X8Y9_CULQU|nr:defective proboscis extension response [Culex quinquefasciatus]|eukprot:XP_001866111.1 defective proboscis extension response [Culex quinquefasciatus]
MALEHLGCSSPSETSGNVVQQAYQRNKSNFKILTTDPTQTASIYRFVQFKFCKILGSSRHSYKSLETRIVPTGGVMPENQRVKVNVPPFLGGLGVRAAAEILEAPDLHIDEGSTLRLECKLKRATESPLYVFWYHEDRMVNYDQEDGISVSTNKLTSSVLTVRNATARHGGNYTCAPANARQSSVYVHVLKGT